MQYQFLTPETIVNTFKTSKKYTEGLTTHFLEYERLARNKPLQNIPKEYPKTTDGTTASIIRKTPHRIIQQIPTGKVISDTNDWLEIVAGFIYTHRIIPHANEGYALMQKCWNVVERSLTFGFCPTYTPFLQRQGYFCTDLRLPYWADVFLQPGKLSDDDSNYIFLRSWWQTKDIEKLIASQEKLSPAKRTWDVDALRTVKDRVIDKEDRAKTPSERAGTVDSKGGVPFITGFQRGYKAKFYTFHEDNKDEKYPGTILRTKENKDPRGELPVNFAYGDIDGFNPMGRSIIELVGSLQNLMDAEMQMYQYNRALMLNPPLVKKGNWNKNKAKFVPNVIIDLGSQPDASLEPLTIDSTALANFPNNYGLMKSQMLNLLSSPDTSISADVGNPGFSKTPQGVEASKANLSIDDNYVRKQFETWFQRWSETAINLYFAERTGVEELQLDNDTADKLKVLADMGKFNPALLSEDNKIRINFDTATPTLKFRVDASSSKRQDDTEQVAVLQQVLPLFTPQANWYLAQDGWKFSMGEAYMSMLQHMNVEGIERMLTKMSPQEAEQAKSQPFPIIDPPQMRLMGTIPPEAMPAALSNGGVNVPQGINLTDSPIDIGDILKDPLTPLSVRAAIQQKAGFQPDIEGAQQAQAAQQGPVAQPESPITPEVILKAHQQSHDQEMDKEKLQLEKQKLEQAAKQAAKQPAQPAVKSKKGA